MAQVSTEAQQLHQVVSEIARARGACDVPAEKGVLRVHPGEGDAIRIEAISTSGKSRFSFTVTRAACELSGPLSAEAFRERYGAEAEVLRGIRKTLERSISAQEGIAFDFNKERMPKSALEGEPPREGTVERERFNWVKDLDLILTDPNGKKIERRGFLVGERVFDLYRAHNEPFTFVMEVGSKDGERDAMLGPRVQVSLAGISYHNADDRAQVGSEQDAVITLKDWLSRVALLSNK